MADPIDKTPVVARVRWKEQRLGMQGVLVLADDWKPEVTFEFELGIMETEALKERARNLAASRGVLYTEEYFKTVAHDKALEKVKQMVIKSMVFVVVPGEPRP